MKYLSIDEELNLCREANKETRVGDVMCFIHHGEPIEILREPLENRLKVILEEKPEKERVIRLRYLRKCPFQLPLEWAEARDKRNEAEAKLAEAKWNEAEAKWNEAEAEWAEARDKWNEACAKRADRINASIKFYFPDCPWDGKTLLPGIRN